MKSEAVHWLDEWYNIITRSFHISVGSYMLRWADGIFRIKSGISFVAYRVCCKTFTESDNSAKFSQIHFDRRIFHKTLVIGAFLLVLIFGILGKKITQIFGKKFYSWRFLNCTLQKHCPNCWFNNVLFPGFSLGYSAINSVSFKMHGGIVVR